MRTSPAAVLAVAVAVVAAPLVQVSVVQRLPLPGQAVPDLVLAAVVVVAVARGRLPGLLAGFGAGLVADLVPPADGVAGRSALVLCLVGHACGRTGRLPVPAVLCLGVAGGSLATAGLNVLLRDPRAWPEAAELPFALPYTLLSALLAWLAVTWWRAAAASRRSTHALPARLGAPARDLSVLRPARPVVAGAGRRRPPLRPRRGGGSRAPRGRPGGAWTHRR
ncbi:rod shape-determining protein MreD [Nonomuraea sp. NPDC003214]